MQLPAKRNPGTMVDRRNEEEGAVLLKPSKNGKANTHDTDKATPVLYSLQTDLDLAGRPSRERLLVAPKELHVIGDDQQRQWRLDDIQEFRIEAAVGSCFLQANVQGRWDDVIRVAGEDDGVLGELVERLNARSRLGRWPEAPDEMTFPLGNAGKSRRERHWKNLGRLMALMRPFAGSAALVLVLSLVAAAIEVAPPMLQKMLVDRVLQAEPHSPMAELLFLLAAIVAGLLVVRFTATVVAIWKGRISSWLGTTLTATLRNNLVVKLNELPLAFHDRNQVGMLMSRVAYDTESLHTLVYHMTGGLLLQLLQLVVITVMLFYLNPTLALVTMIPMPLIVAGSWYFTRHLNPRNHQYWEAVGKQAAALTGMLSGIRVVKAFVQENRENRRFHDSSMRLRDSRQAVDTSIATFTALLGFVFALGGLAAWYMGGRQVLFGDMTLGSLMAFLAYLAMFFAPLTAVAESMTSFSNFWTASQRIFDLLETPSEEDSPPPSNPDARFEGRIEFENVSFGYHRNLPVLRDISFSIEPGQFVGVVGRSGSGKSTLVSLLARLYEIDSGRIVVGGMDTRQLSRRELRRRIGIVLQEPFLFRGSVAANITYGNQDATPPMILRAAKYADAHDFILRMPLAYENHLGESGSGLSGGERQRLSIARALLFDPKILILDEATSSVDAESERAIRDAVQRFARGRTTIAIAHRLSTLRGADHLLVFDQGRLVEQGTHDELLAQNGVYATLINIQMNLRESSRRMRTAVGVPHARNGEAALAELAGGNDDLLHTFPLEDGTDGDHREREELQPCEIRWLDPSLATIEDDGRGVLSVSVDGRRYSGARAYRAFPASHQDQWISLRFQEPLGRELELGMIESLDAWPQAAQDAVRRALGRRYHFCRIREIHQLRTRGSQLTFSVLADTGPAKFVVERPHESSQPFGQHGLLLLDNRANCYVIPDRSVLPRNQQRLLTLYFDE
jgi:ATP-binding cassette subfamily B protein